MNWIAKNYRTIFVIVAVIATVYVVKTEVDKTHVSFGFNN